VGPMWAPVVWGGAASTTGWPGQARPVRARLRRAQPLLVLPERAPPGRARRVQAARLTAINSNAATGRTAIRAVERVLPAQVTRAEPISRDAIDLPIRAVAPPALRDKLQAIRAQVTRAQAIASPAPMAGAQQAHADPGVRAPRRVSG
jgi:hypothetical protein